MTSMEEKALSEREPTLADAWVEEAKHPKPPTNAWDFGKTLVFWLAVIAIVYVVVRYG